MGSFDPPMDREGMSYDPVCRMWVDPATAAARSEHEGRVVHFCAPACKRVFDASPARFAARLPPAGLRTP